MADPYSRMRLRSGMSPNVPRFWRQTERDSREHEQEEDAQDQEQDPRHAATLAGGRQQRRDDGDDAEIAPEWVAQRHMPLPVMNARVPSPAMTKAMIENCNRLRRLSEVRAE